MDAPSPIVVPIALSQTRSAIITLPWFVQRTAYNPAGATYRPLVNGEETFGALYDAIDKANCTIDYVCWGFQPSMYFKRDGGKSLRIGDLLIKKAKAGVKVRILCWLDKAWVAQISEQQVPEYDTMRSMTQNEDARQRAYDRNGYYCARRSPGARPPAVATAGSQMYPQLKANPWPLPGTHSLKDIGIELVTRDFSRHDREEIMYREKLMRDAGIGPTFTTIAAYGAEPSHHQKMVLIDYEAPEHAVGFVMGHNTLDA